MEHLSGTPHERALALIVNHRIAWKSHSSLLPTFVKYEHRKFYNIEPFRIRNVRQMDIFHIKLVPYIVNHKHTHFDKHTSLIWNRTLQIRFYSTGS